MGKTFFYVSIGILIFFGLFIVLTWLAIRDSSEDVSTQEPYKALRGQSFQTIIPVYLTRQFEHEYYKEGFRLSTDTSGTDSLSILFEKGTELVFTRAEYTKRGVSGTEYIYLLGELKNTKGEKFPFEYIWATPNFYYENESGKWNHKTPFWK